MKKLSIIYILILSVKIGLACSCYPYEPNFYKNIYNSPYNCIAIFDTMDYSYEYNDLHSQTGYFIVIDTIGNFNSDIGDTIIVTGQDGLNCGELLNGFSRGDTMLLALSGGFYQSFEKDTFYLEGVCGKHYLKIEHGQHAGLSMTEIKNKIHKIFERKESACFCEDFWDSYNFYNNVSKVSSHCLVVFHGYDYAYSYNGMNAQTGYFELLDTVGNLNMQTGDTLVVIGEDGINCGAMLHRFTPGDTLFLALSEEYYESFEKDTFHLKGGACGKYFLEISNGQHNGLTIFDIKEKIKSNITSIEKLNDHRLITVYPNPAHDQLTIKSDNLIIHNIKIFNVSGNLMHSIHNIHNNSVNVKLDMLTAGIYHVRVVTGNGNVIRKILKE